MQILSFETLESTQEYLKDLLKNKKLSAPIALTCETQTQGVGSRENEWMGFKGNLFVSFALELKALPKDLNIASASIYFSHILKETLRECGSKVWLKWPNDLYIQEKKIGGMITSVVGQNIVCGFGVNLLKAPEGFAILDVKIDKTAFLKRYFQNIEKKELWKQVFSKYKLEFERNKNFSTHNKNKKINLNEATLESDGSLNINGERMYSLR